MKAIGPFLHHSRQCQPLEVLVSLAGHDSLTKSLVGLDGDLTRTMQPPYLLGSLDHPDQIHIEANVDDLIASEQFVKLLTETSREIFALGADHQPEDLPVGEYVTCCSEEILVKMDIQVREQLGHCIAADVLNPR